MVKITAIFKFKIQKMILLAILAQRKIFILKFLIILNK